MAATATGLALVVGIGGGWAAKSLLTPPSPLPTAPGYVLATATQDTVARSLSLDAKAVWAGGAQVDGSLPGTVTSVKAKGAAQVRVGQTVFDVDLKPVVVAEGSVPAFRDMTAGVNGADVTQLQRFLNTVTGAHGPVDGKFGTGLTAQVKAWQKAMRVPATGNVPKGSLLFVPTLPAVMSVSDQVRVGSSAPVGAPALKVLPAAPSFSVLLPTNQASMTKPGMPVRLSLGQSNWSGRISRLGAPGDDGSVLAVIGPTVGATSVCGASCSAVPVAGATVNAAIEVVPATTGVTVPTQALVVDANGGAAVLDAEGRSVPVTVKATSGGIAVVDGLADGRQIRVPTSG